MSSTVLRRQFVWTVVPSGRVEQLNGHPVARFSVLVTPRLLGPVDSRLTVSAFGMQQWPKRLSSAHFQVFRGETPIESQVVPFVATDGSTLALSVDQQVVAWQKLFPDDLLVRPYKVHSYKDRATREFPASEVGAQIRDAYSSITSIVSRSEKDELKTASGDPWTEWKSSYWSKSDDTSLFGVTVPALQRAYEFYARDSAKGFTKPKPLAKKGPPELDFHDIVARLNDHPLLLRALGLLIEFVAPVDNLKADGSDGLRVVPQWENKDIVDHQDLTPRTAYTLENTRFVPLEGRGTSRSAMGMLRLAAVDLQGVGVNCRFEVVPFDVDGASLRLFTVIKSCAAPKEFGNSCRLK